MKILQKQGFVRLLLSITMLFSGINIPVLADNAEEISNNLITDGSFDTTTEIANGNWWGTPPDIGVWQYSGDNAVTVETDEKTSNQYAKMIAKTGLGQNVNVEANSDYVLTAKIKGSAATLNINDGTVAWPAKNGSSSLAYSDVAASEDWQTVTVEYSNESYDKLFVYLWVENGTINIDDVTLTKKGEIPSNPNEIKVTANKTAQWTSQQAKENFDLRIHGWSEWENAAYMGFTLPESVTLNKIGKAELVITTTSVKNDANHTSFPKAWLYGADYSAFENGAQYEGTDNAPTYNTAEILEFDSPTVNGESKYNITEYIKTMKENNTAFRVDVKSQNSNNTWLIGSCTNGAKAPQLIITLNEENGQEATPDIGIDYETEELTGFVDGENYTLAVGMDNAELVTSENGRLAITDLYLGKTLHIIKKGSSTTLDSEEQILNIPLRPAALTDEDITAVDAQTIGGTGSISGITENMEYSVDHGVTWSIGNGQTIENIVPGTTYKIRKKAVSGNSFKSEDYTVTINAYNAEKEDTPNVSIDYENETIIGFKPNVKYRINNTEIIPADNTIAVEQYIGTVVSIVKMGNGTTTKDSEIQTVDIPARPSAPNAQAVNETPAKNDGKIINVTAAMQYKAEHETEWKDCMGTEITGLTAGTYNVRMKAVVNTSFVSTVTTIVIEKYTEPVSDPITVTADKTAQWIANSGDSKSYDLDIHGWETWETAAYIGFTLPDDFVPSEIGTAKLIVNTTSAAGSGPGRAYAAYYDGFDNGGYYEGVDRLPGYINTKTIAKFDTPDKNTTGDFEIDITSYIRGLGDAKNAAVRLDAESGQINMRWKIGSCKTGTAPRLVLVKGEYVEPTPEPTEEPVIEPDAVPASEFVNLDFSNGISGWTTSVKGETVGSVSAENGTAILGNKSSVYQIANGLVQGSYTMNVWVKGTATGNTSYIRAEKTGGPAAESKVDTFINSSGYTCISLRNVLIYNGQCKIKIFSGKGCSLTLDKVEFVLDSNDNNPVLNWGFENGLENWTTDGTIEVIETDADTGSKAAKLAPNSEIRQTITVKPNTRYIATVRAKVDTQDTWEKVETYYTDGANKGKKSDEYSVTLTNGDRINLGVRNASGVVLRQAPAGLEGYSLLTIAFKTGADDTSVTLYANTKYDDSYKNSVKVYGDGATGDSWTGNKGNAYIDNFDFFTREESVVLGIDVSYLPIIEDNNGKYYANGVQQDFLAIMANRGVTAVNGMIFVHGGADAMKPGTNSVALTMPNGFDKYYWYEIAERAKALDMDYMANFMLSDVWMNAVSAYTPIDWMRWNKEKNIYENQTLDEMKTSVYNYIYDFLDGLKQRNITPIAVKIGNEEDGGICWNVGKYTKDSYNITKGFQELINSGYDAAHDVFPDAPAFLHTYQGYNTSYSKKWFNAMDTAGVKYDGRAYSLYGLSPTYNILAMLNQDNEIAPYQDTMHVETGIQATYHEADNVGNDTKHVQLDYWSATPNGQYNYLLEYMQGLKDVPNPHSVMRGVFWWAAEWLEVEGAGWIVDDGCSVGGRTLVNNGDPNIHEMGSTADGKPGDVYESAYSYLWRGEAKNKQADAATPLKGYGKYTVTKADKPTSIVMEKSKITLTEGEFEKLHITLAPSNAVYNWTVNWTSSNETVATVGEHGVVKALGEGTAMITAVTEDGKLTASCEVTVLPSVKATNDDITIELEAYGKTVNGESIGMLTDNLMKLNITLPEAVKNQTVKVTSSNPDAVTFLGEHWQPNEKGVLYQQTNETTAIELNSHTEGTSVITVTADGGASQSFTVNVTENNMSDISELMINKTELQLEATFSEKLNVYIYPQNASGNKITWISENEAIATVDNEGKVTGINVGETVITASAGGHSVKCKVTVTPTSQIKRTITTEGDITLDSDDIYRFPGSAAAIKTDFAVDKGKITIEFDAQLLKDSGKYTELIIKDNADNPIITWKCSEYGGEENLYYVQTGDFEANDKDTAFTGVINGTSTETAYTHFKSVIDLDSKTAVLYLSNQKVASGTITSDNVAGFSIYSNHKWRPISVKNISIIGENTVPKGPHINELYTSLDKDGVLNYSLSYEGTEKSTVYIALYDEDGALVNCTAETGGKIQLDRFGKYQMKAFLWEDMKPLDKAVTRDIDYSDMGGYLFVHFIGKESTADEEQIYFSLSEDGQNWQTLNNGNQYLESTVGEKGVRDPHIVRSPEGDKFYIIATDLGIYNRRDDDDRWNTCQREGSRGIVVWESSDLINWSEPRLANVMGDDCGCVWAPECIYDKEKGEYMVYWASRTSADNYQWLRAYRSYTKDFVTFTEPELWIDHATAEQMANNTALHTFDMTILEHNGKYYRFTKTNTVTMEETDSLSGEWKTVENYELYKTVSNYEGPTVYKANGEDKWYMLLDCLSNNNKGYKPFVTTDIANGAFSQAADFNFDVTYRHGTVIPITRTEYSNLTK